MHNSAALLPELLDDGIRVLIYAGEGSFRSSSAVFMAEKNVANRRCDVQLAR